MKVALAVFACFFTLAESGRSGSYHASAPSAAPSAAPSVATVPSPSEASKEPSLKVEDIRFNLENFNFFDLQRKLAYTSDNKKSGSVGEKDEKDEKNQTEEVPKLTINLEKEAVIASNETKNADVSFHIKNQHQHNQQKRQERQRLHKHWTHMEKSEESLLSTGFGSSHVGTMNCRLSHDDAPSCILDLLQDTIESTIKDLIDTALAAMPSAPAASMASAPGPAMASAPAVASVVEAKPAATLLQQSKRDAPTGAATPQGLLPAGSAPSPSAMVSPPSPGPEASPVGVTVRTTFRPGKTRELASSSGQSVLAQTAGEGRVTVVDVVVYGNPDSGVDELPMVDTILANYNEEGLLVPAITEALLDASGIKPHITNLDTKAIKIEQWSIDTCSAHMADAVAMMTQAYTRRQVPVALFNECTNFMPQVSFSQDTLIDDLDTHRCRLATADFAKRWNSGADDSVNYRAFCVDVCEYKYGHSMPLCHITSGEKLLNQAP